MKNMKARAPLAAAQTKEAKRRAKNAFLALVEDSDMESDRETDEPSPNTRHCEKKKDDTSSHFDDDISQWNVSNTTDMSSAFDTEQYKQFMQRWKTTPWSEMESDEDD
jgi:hypothetical protein